MPTRSLPDEHGLKRPWSKRSKGSYTALVLGIMGPPRPRLGTLLMTGGTYVGAVGKTIRRAVSPDMSSCSVL